MPPRWQQTRRRPRSRWATIRRASTVAATASEPLAFNRWYDSMSGYRFTPWQWVQVSPGWVSYTVRIGDAAFANTWGWDFAINAAGNRTEELVIRSVTVRKVAP